MSPEIGYRLTEEVVRWRYELHLANSDAWWIAFTNPTAGPWKRLMGRDGSGMMGEVYRFPRDEDRPDVVAVSDVRRLILIVEAKDTAPRLKAPDQVAKSSAVVKSLKRVLSGLASNASWGDRARYDVIAGLLWGRPSGDAEVDANAIFALYRRQLEHIPLVGFETTQLPDGTLTIREFAEKESSDGRTVFT